MKSYFQNWLQMAIERQKMYFYKKIKKWSKIVKNDQKLSKLVQKWTFYFQNMLQTALKCQKSGFLKKWSKIVKNDQKIVKNDENC